jgi:hypothetical protein
MTAFSSTSGALGCLFIKCSGIGLLDDPVTRRYKASISVAMWLIAVAFTVLCAFSYWIFDLGGTYETLWPFRGSDPRIRGLGAILVLGGPALYIGFRVGRRYARYAKPKASFGEAAGFVAWSIAVLGSMLANLTKIGSLIALALHIAVFFYLIYESKRRVLAEMSV